MPYNNISDLPKTVKELPTQAKKLFIKVFNSVYEKYGEERAFKIAWSAVKEKYKKKDNKWVLKRSFNTQCVLRRSGFFKPLYFFDKVLTTADQDSLGVSVDESLMEKLVKENKIHPEADIEHLSTEGDRRYKGAYKLIKPSYKDGELRVRFYLDKTHPKAKELIKYHKENEKLGLSAEFYDYILQDNKVINCSSLGWTITTNPINKQTLR